MITNKAIGELADWARAALEGDRENADGHLRHFYHIGASLLASREFQRRWQQDFHARIDSEHLECVCKFLETIARIEADQLEASARQPLAA